MFGGILFYFILLFLDLEVMLIANVIACGLYKSNVRSSFPKKKKTIQNISPVYILVDNPV
jgi:hypothetical protein